MGRILVIEDDAEMRAMLRETLTSAGYEVFLSADGKEGMKQYREKPADLVITDIFMPTQEGLETIIKLRRYYPSLPIVAISGNSAAARPMLTVAQQLGATEILQKPFFAPELLAVVTKILPSSQVANGEKN